MAAWLSGNGCVPINHLMEDAATAEISRAQIWQWVHHETGIIDEGRNITYGYFKALMREEMESSCAERVGDRNVRSRSLPARPRSLLDEIHQEQRICAVYHLAGLRRTRLSPRPRP